MILVASSCDCLPTKWPTSRTLPLLYTLAQAIHWPTCLLLDATPRAMEWSSHMRRHFSTTWKPVNQVRKELVWLPRLDPSSSYTTTLSLCGMERQTRTCSGGLFSGTCGRAWESSSCNWSQCRQRRKILCKAYRMLCTFICWLVLRSSVW